MVSKSSSDSSASKLKASLGEQWSEHVASLSVKMNQLKKQIQAERVVSIKEKVEKNRKKLDTDVSQLILEISRRTTMFTGQNGVAKMLSSRASNPLHKYAGFPQGLGEKDYVNCHDMVLGFSGTKLPYMEKIPPYTTWMFLDRNQRMAEDQSVVGRRRIYYDQHGSEALICSDSEEDLIEAEEDKHEFSEGEDCLIWTLLQEYGLVEELINVVSQFVGISTSEIEERFGVLKEKYDEEENVKDLGDSGHGRGISLDKTLDAALDSFDNLFCRRCLVFDCRLHGCSQTLINPSEKQPYWSEYEDDRKPCSNQCFLRLRATKELPEGSVDKTLQKSKATTMEKQKMIMLATDAEELPCADVIARDEKYDSGKENTPTSEAVHNHELPSGALNESADVVPHDIEPLRKRKVSQKTHLALDDSTEIPTDITASPSKKQKNILTPPVVAEAVDGASGLYYSSSDKSITDKSEAQINSKTLDHDAGDDAKNEAKVLKPNQLHSKERKVEGDLCRSEWKPIEKELYLKGVEIFGKNSCLIARNLLSGLRTCMEVSNYMCDTGASAPHRSVASRSYLEDNDKDDTNHTEQEMPTRPRMIRRRGRTRKLKYSWKSTGHPSMWKRIADGKNQSCKQYTPCGCQSMCGKQCSCLNNGTCCEKYCGCSKNCKNRFRGCHCAKSQCRSRQCPCFAAGRECDPDVCRNCWVSCGDGSLGEPPKRGDGQCGNMRLLLRQQQRILLAKSDVAGWGAFLKNSVNKNDYLGEYTGELISHREADKRGKIYDRANSSFLFDLNDEYVLDAYRKGDKLKFANHSSNPNCYAKVMLVAGDHRVGIFAKEHIDASEELFYDYRYGPDQAPAWARKPEGSKREDSTVSQGRAKKHQSHS